VLAVNGPSGIPQVSEALCCRVLPVRYNGTMACTGSSATGVRCAVHGAEISIVA
jgi:hypothetical protein